MGLRKEVDIGIAGISHVEHGTTATQVRSVRQVSKLANCEGGCYGWSAWK
jgi:hypothetical protein